MLISVVASVMNAPLHYGELWAMPDETFLDRITGLTGFLVNRFSKKISP
jgi:hypothetical protein